MNAGERSVRIESLCVQCKKSAYERHLSVRADQMNKFPKYVCSLIIERQ